MPDNSRSWFPLRDKSGMLTMRRYNRQIELRWGHWTGRAVLVREHAEDRPRWATPGPDRRLHDLPPRKVRSWRDAPNGELIDATRGWLDRNGWGSEPDAWRPLAGERWPDALPDPINLTPSPEGRAVRIDHVAFNAAQAAAEMEDERQWRRDRREDGDTLPARLWWRDGTRVAYSLRGQISAEECEGRVLRALYWYGRGAICKHGTGSSPLARMVVQEAQPDDVDERAGRLPPLVRMPAETDERILEAMGWVAELLQSSKHAKRWVALLTALATDKPTTLARAGAMAGLAGTSTADTLARALKHLRKIANGGTPKRDAKLAASRQRTKATRQTDAAPI